jgi:hypothetical protein
MWGVMLMPAVWVLNAVNIAFALFWWGALLVYSMGTGLGLFITLIDRDHPGRWLVWMLVAGSLHLFAITAAYLHQRGRVDQELGAKATLRLKRLMANEVGARAVERYWLWLGRQIRARASPRQ